MKWTERGVKIVSDNMNLVGGAMSSPVLVGNDKSLKRSKAAIHHMVVHRHQDLTAVVQRNLSIIRGLCAVDTLLLVFCVQEVLNFEQWEAERVVEGVLAQDLVVELEMDCFGDLVA